MTPYKDNYTRDGIDFTVTKREGNICLLTGTYQHTPDHHTYEVHILKMAKAHPKSDDAGRMILSAPSACDWGTYGFTFLTMDAAQAKFEELVEEFGRIAV